MQKPKTISHYNRGNWKYIFFKRERKRDINRDINIKEVRKTITTGPLLIQNNKNRYK